MFSSGSVAIGSSSASKLPKYGGRPLDRYSRRVLYCYSLSVHLHHNQVINGGLIYCSGPGGPGLFRFSLLSKCALHWQFFCWPSSSKRLRILK